MKYNYVITDDLTPASKRLLRRQRRKMRKFHRKLKRWERQGKIFTAQYQNEPTPPKEEK